MKILVVEDEKRMAQALRRGLEEECYSVTMTADGISAVELGGSDHFDLILLDLMLPGIDGFEVTRRLRRARFYWQGSERLNGAVLIPTRGPCVSQTWCWRGRRAACFAENERSN